MRARFYDKNTRLLMFSADITENKKGSFTEALEAAGFEYIKQRDCWVDKKQGVECVIFEG